MATNLNTPVPDQTRQPFTLPTTPDKGALISPTWFRWLLQLWEAVNAIASSVVTGPASPNKSVQYNKAGVFGGDANLTWDDAIKQMKVEGLAAGSSAALVATTAGAGHVSLVPSNPQINEVFWGGVQDGAGDLIPDSTILVEVFEEDGFSVPGQQVAGLEMTYGLTPAVPDPFTNGVGFSIRPPTDTSGELVDAFHVYQYGGLGTGAKPGMTVFADRNDSGAGAASTLGLEQLDGTDKFIWFDNTGAPRYGPDRPTESGSVSDTSGTLFASGVTIMRRAVVNLNTAQIKALPTTPFQVIAAPGVGFWIKVLAVTYETHVLTAYTNLNATYTDFHLLLDTYYASYGPVDDATTTPALTIVTQLLTTVADILYEVAQPNMEAIGASATTVGYVQNINLLGTGQGNNKPLMFAMDNNGSGNLTGGNAGDNLRVTVYYAIENLA